jgi:hypothetical protein
MKTAGILLLVGALFVLSGCMETQTAKSESSQKTLPPDRFEVLAWHPLRRSREADSEVIRLETEIAKHDNKCLNEEIAILEGRAVGPKDRVKAEDHRALAKATEKDLARMVQGMLDTEDAIEAHNRKHPGSPMAETTNNKLVRLMCGDCTQERAIRYSQLKEEAQERPNSKK